MCSFQIMLFRSEIKRSVKIETNILQNGNSNNSNVLDSKFIINESGLDKALCESVYNILPKRDTTDLQQFKDFLKDKTKNVNDINKAFILFLWVCNNIIYDTESYFAGRKSNCDPEAVFKNGVTVCSGYARLFKSIGEFINLEIQCISCYSKGIGYEPGQNLTRTDHEYNIIKLNNKYYPIDCTWGSGNINGKTFENKINEFYFLADPELLINTHFPANDKWQLTKKKYTLEEFLKWPQIAENFFSYGFNKYYPAEGLIELTDTNFSKYIIWGDNIPQNNASSQIFLLEGNIYNQQLNLDKIDFFKDRIEFDFIFNQKGRYKIKLFGNNDKSNTTHNIMTYIVNVHNDSSNVLKYPYFLGDSKDVILIEPLYDNIKSGQKVKFRLKTDKEEIDTLIIIDGNWHYLNKDENGFFEKEIKIKTGPGKNVIVGKRKDNNDCNCSYMISYTIVK